MSSRERFEAWLKGITAYSRDFDRFGAYAYISPITQLKWDAWQAAERETARRCAKVVMDLALVREDDMIHEYRGTDTGKAMAWDANQAIRKEFPGAWE